MPILQEENSRGLDISSKARFLIAFFVLGFMSQVVQVVFIREISVVFYGTELSLGVTFAAWFLCVALGSGAAVLFAMRLNPVGFFGGIAPLFIAVILPASLYLVRISPGFFDVPCGTDIPLWALPIVAVVAIGPFCFATGLCFTVAVRCAGDMAILYLVEAAGCLTGGAIFHFLLVDLLSPFVLLGLLATLLVLSLIYFAWPSYGRGKKVLAGVWTGGTVLILCLGGTLEKKTREFQWQCIAPQMSLLKDDMSRYGYLAVLEYRGQKNFYGNGRYVMATAENDMYHGLKMAHLSLIQHRKPERVLVVGEAMSGFLREALKYMSGSSSELHYCEMDPELVKMARAYLSEVDRRVLTAPQVKLHYGDGRRLVESHLDYYDIIAILVGDPATIALNRYYTLEFFGKARTALRKGGVLILALSSSPHPTGEMLKRNALVLRTLAGVFENVAVHVASDSPAIFFASDGEYVSLCPAECKNRLPAFVKQDLGSFRPEFYDLWLTIAAEREAEKDLKAAAFLEEESVAEGGIMEIPASLLNEPEMVSPSQTRRPGPIVLAAGEYNSDFHPMAVLSTLRLTGMLSLSEQKFKDMVVCVKRLLKTSALAMIGILLFTGAAGLLRPNALCRKISISWAIAISGFFGMSVEIVLLWAFLSIYGHIYTMVGLFAATFMLGLTIGAWLARRWPAQRRPMLALAIVMASIGAYLAVLSPLLQSLRGEAGALLLILNLIAGIPVGMAFPLAGFTYSKMNSPALAAGVLYSSDMVGACLGSLIIGSFALPLWGIADVCLALAAVSFAGALAIGGNYRKIM